MGAQLGHESVELVQHVEEELSRSTQPLHTSSLVCVGAIDGDAYLVVPRRRKLCAHALLGVHISFAVPIFIL